MNTLHIPHHPSTVIIHAHPWLQGLQSLSVHACPPPPRFSDFNWEYLSNIGITPTPLRMLPVSCLVLILPGLQERLKWEQQEYMKKESERQRERDEKFRLRQQLNDLEQRRLDHQRHMDTQVDKVWVRWQPVQERGSRDTTKHHACKCKIGQRPAPQAECPA